jgi:phage shock protein C
MNLKPRLYRSRDDRMLAGVAGGLANYFDVDPALVRLGFVLGFFTTGPLAVMLYLACAIVVPQAPETTLV